MKNGTFSSGEFVRTSANCKVIMMSFCFEATGSNQHWMSSCRCLLPFEFHTNLHLSCSGFHQIWPTPLPSWSQNLGTTCSSGSGRKSLANDTPPFLCWFVIYLDIKIISVRAFNSITQSHLCSHDETGSCGVDGDIASHQSHILELLIHLSVLLVGEGLDGAGKDHPLLFSEGQCNGVPKKKEEMNMPG